jgi:hypothetical protein
MKKPITAQALLLMLVLSMAACSGGGGGGASAPVQPPAPSADTLLATAIRSDARLAQVRAKAKQLVAGSLSAGSIYGAVYIRDLNTFTELAIEAQGAPVVRSQLRQFLDHQADDGNIADGIALADGATFKATVEVDQETSLVQAIAKYVAISGDKAFLSEVVRGVSVVERLENALTFLYQQRFSARYGMIFSATRADWGDVQPEDSPGTMLTANSHSSITVYDNAMLTLALVNLQALDKLAGRDASLWVARERDLRAAVRTTMWTGTQFMAHLYLEQGSPFPAGFDESRMYFQGGTAVAIQAGLLQPAEVSLSFTRMIKNKVDSASGSVGVSIYPPYPAGFFKNTEYMGAEYYYQNGGDWPWFGARIVQQMVANGQVQSAYQELGPMLDRVLRDNGFFEWYTRDGIAKGSGDYRGTAGQIVVAIDMLQAWAAAH